MPINRMMNIGADRPYGSLVHIYGLVRISRHFARWPRRHLGRRPEQYEHGNTSDRGE
jgi:hypothetical protein